MPIQRSLSAQPVIVAIKSIRSSLPAYMLGQVAHSDITHKCRDAPSMLRPRAHFFPVDTHTKLFPASSFQRNQTRDLILLSVTFLASVRFRCCRCYSTPLQLIQDNHGSCTRLHISDVIDIRNSLPMICHWLFRSLFAEGQAGGRCVIRQNHVPNTKTREGCYK